MKPQSLESARVMDDAALRREIFTPDLRGLVAWLETQPADEEYKWFDSSRCVCGKFLKAIGRPFECREQSQVFGEDWDGPTANYLRVTRGMPRTFGGALQRARSLTSAAFREGEGK